MSERITTDLDMVPEKREHYPFRTFNYASTVTTQSSSRGSALSSYNLLPITWARDLIAAAKEKTMFLSTARETVTAEGNASVILPYVTKNIDASSAETSSEEYAAGAEIAWTAITNNDGLVLTPTWYNYGVAISNKDLHTNAIDLVADARDKLSYIFETKVDSLISTALQSATAMSNTVNGMQTIFGGDATSAANNLDAGDIMTTNMISKARRLLMSNIGHFWSSNVWTKSAVTKNAWNPDPAEPFVLYVAPEQGQALIDDPQFTNSAEYGSNEVVLNGEIGKLPFLGIKIIETTKVPAVAAGGTIVFQGGTVAEDVACHECFLVKARRSHAVGWAKKQNITAFNWPNADQVRIAQGFALDAKTLYNDAIVRLVVTDE